MLATPVRPSHAPLERWGLAAALLAAPAVFLAAQVMPREESLFATLKARSDLWLISHLLLATWLVLLIPILVALGLLLGHAGWLYRVVGGMLAVIGIVVNGLITGVDLVLGAIPPLDESLTSSVHKTITAAVLIPLDQWDLALPLGLVILAIGLYRTRGAPQWMAHRRRHHAAGGLLLA